jgi:hypothetical protein
MWQNLDHLIKIIVMVLRTQKQSYSIRILFPSILEYCTNNVGVELRIAKTNCQVTANNTNEYPKTKSNS